MKSIVRFRTHLLAQILCIACCFSLAAIVSAQQVSETEAEVAAETAEGLASVVRDVHLNPEDVDRLGIDGVHADLPEDPTVGGGDLGHVLVVLAGQTPVGATVIVGQPKIQNGTGGPNRVLALV